MKDLSLQSFGRLIAIEPTKKVDWKLYWWCHCECGNFTEVRQDHLTRGEIVSCGCYNNEHRNVFKPTHGMDGTPLQNVWFSMRQRCRDTNLPSYHRYGGRGITVCDEWKTNFSAFHSWAISAGYAPGLSIDRIDNDGNYCPENCRWATRAEQANNRRSNSYLSVHGICKTIAQWSKLAGVDQSMMRYWLINNRLTGWLEVKT